MRPLRSLSPALLLALACGPGGGDDTGASATSSSASAASAGTTDASTASPTGGGTGDSATGGTGGGTATSTTGTTGPGTTGPASTTDATTAPATTGPSTTGGSTGGDTGGPVSCGVIAPDHGDCDLALGVGFDGVECAPRSGCDCAPDCDKFFPDMASCALACAAAGHCNEDRLHGAGLAKDPVEQGDLCDEIDVCPSDAALADVFEQIFGMLTCEGMGFPCQGQVCHGLWQNMLGPEEWLKTCAASLVQSSGSIFCVVFGP